MSVPRKTERSLYSGAGGLTPLTLLSRYVCIDFLLGEGARRVTRFKTNQINKAIDLSMGVEMAVAYLHWCGVCCQSWVAVHKI